MTEASAFRLDLGDQAAEAGWQCEHFGRIDEFSKGAVAVMVRFGAGEEIESLTRSREGRDDEFYGADSRGKAERLRGWLGLRAGAVPKTLPSGLPDIPFGQDTHGDECWTLESFAAAVGDPQDRDFLLRILNLLAANVGLNRTGFHAHSVTGVPPSLRLHVQRSGRPRTRPGGCGRGGA